MVDIGVNIQSSQYNGYHKELLDHAYDAGLYGIIVISNSIKESTKNDQLLKTELFKTHNLKQWFTVGCHPHSAKDFKNQDIITLETLIKTNPQVVAIGECGLDYNRNFSPVEKQKEVFKAQLQLYAQYDKPLYLHCRDAVKDMDQMLNDFMRERSLTQLKGVVHCFTDGPDEMKLWTSKGLSIGITGWICDQRRNSKLVRAVKEIDLEKLLIETDSPWLTPPEYVAKFNTRRNEPDSLDYIVKAISKYRKVSENTVWEISVDNTKTLFSIDF